VFLLTFLFIEPFAKEEMSVSRKHLGNLRVLFSEAAILFVVFGGFFSEILHGLFFLEFLFPKVEVTCALKGNFLVSFHGTPTDDDP